VKVYPLTSSAPDIIKQVANLQPIRHPNLAGYFGAIAAGKELWIGLNSNERNTIKIASDYEFSYGLLRDRLS